MKTVLVAALALGGLAVAVVVALVLLGNATTGEMTEPVRRQMEALQAGDVDRAAALVDGDFGFRAFLEAHPIVKGVRSFAVLESDFHGDEGLATVEVTSTGGSERLVWRLVKRDAWRVRAIESVPAATPAPTTGRAAARLVEIRVTAGEGQDSEPVNGEPRIHLGHDRKYFIVFRFDRPLDHPVEVEVEHRVEGEGPLAGVLTNQTFRQRRTFEPSGDRAKFLLRVDRTRDNDESDIDWTAGHHALTVTSGDVRLETRYWVR